MPPVVAEHQTVSTNSEFFNQPKAVWAVAFACVVGFMGIGLVDPILPAIARGLRASPSQVELLFTSYFGVTAVMMLVTGVVSSRLGPRTTLLAGLLVIVVFASLSGSSGSVGELVGMRAGWGLGNALFIATALAVIVGSATGGVPGAIILYESALGLGISMGPLVGGLLGGISWRGPFFGTATLMAIGFALVATLLGPVPKPARPTGFLDPLRAVRDPGLRTIAVMALFYNFGFFTILAYTPFVIHQSVHVLGLIYFGWGVLLAITAVFLAPRLERRFGTVIPLYGVLASLTALLAIMALVPRLGIIVAVIASGAVLGVNNTLVTQAAMTVSRAERPVASAGYNFVRWIGGAVAPWLAGELAVKVGARVPFVVGAVGVALGAAVLASGRRHLGALPQMPQHSRREPQVGDAVE
ncbi:MAG: MFS transporter [Candidatus Dormibacteria bacterium]